MGTGLVFAWVHWDSGKVQELTGVGLGSGLEFRVSILGSPYGSYHGYRSKFNGILEACPSRHGLAPKP